MPDFIGVVDLTVRLSSMNPLGHIDVQDANRRFESAIIQACQTLYDAAAKNPTLAASYVEKGIVPYGASDKYFQFDRYEDIILYARTLRSRLIAQRLPFKLCISRGDLTRGSLTDKLTQLLAGLPDDAKELPATGSEEIEAVFNTRNRKQIETLLKLYRAQSSSESSVMLSTAMEAFKGFGIWIDAAIVEAGVTGTFRNYFPTRGPARRLVVDGFLDCPFALDKNDVIIRFAGEAPVPAETEGGKSGKGARREAMPADPDTVVLLSGMSAMIDDILDLLRRSSKAGEDNSIYYVSLLTTIVRSSYFGKLDRLAQSRPVQPGSKKKLATGWQHFPPIFHTLALDHRHRAMIRKIPGIELTLAAMIDEVHAALTQEGTSAALPLTQTPARDEAARIRIRDARAKDGIFGNIVRHIEATFGEAMMRRIWGVPIDVLNDERKRAMLEVMTSK